jgi:hypothetical protein
LRETLIVDGTLAYRMQRAAAAGMVSTGREVLTLPRLAARLAGGFVEPAGAEAILPAIREALGQGRFRELGRVADLPGTPRAVFETLRHVWSADLRLAEVSGSDDRIADLAMIERSVRAALGPSRMLPPDLRDEALRRVRHAPSIFGRISIERLAAVDEVWRPLVVALGEVLPVRWLSVGGVDRSWFNGTVLDVELVTPKSELAQSCADQRSEVVEALRWARQILSSGDVPACTIAIAAATPHPYDEAMLVLRRDSGLPIHFAGGIPALSSHEGQICAALSDVLTRGIDQRRVRRLVSGLPPTALSSRIPRDWSKGLAGEAGLFTPRQWAAALERSRQQREDGDQAERALLPILELVTHGPARAVEIGEALLSGRSLAIWRQALRMAPAAALSMSLAQLRVPDDTDPANSIAWCTADQLVASPRSHVRLLGLHVRSWPRADKDDPLVPNHVLARRKLVPRSLTDRDRESFRAIRGQALHVAYSYPRRSQRGGMQAPSPLWPKALEVELPRLRVPEHAFSENDRLLARPKDAGGDERVVRTRACWKAWHSPEITEHDGLIGPNDVTVRKALEKVHPPSAIRLLLRDPQAFVWVQALGWRSTRLESRPLELDEAAFGELVHAVIAEGIISLDAGGGVQRAGVEEREAAIASAAREVWESWPSQRAVPPGVLWDSAVQMAEKLAQHALAVDAGLSRSIRSWVEVAFGGIVGSAASPWDANLPVRIPGTDIYIRGRIDRLDVAESRVAMRITDYKTFEMPQERFRTLISGGRELQRVLYAMAARELLPDIGRVAARLVYLRDEAAERKLENEELDGAFQTVTGFVLQGSAEVLEGRALPGPDARERHSRYRIALPADLQRYFEIKGQAIRDKQGALQKFWDAD